MKRQHLVATLGTLALAANLLLPGLALGQVDANQTGTATVACNNVDPMFYTTDNEIDDAFNFYEDGTSGTIYASFSSTNVFNNPTGSELSPGTTDGDFIEILDQRDPSESGCNDGLTLTVTVEDDGTADGRIFDSNPAGASGYSIPLTGVYYVSDGDTCPATYTNFNNICFKSTALCGEGDGVTAVTCDATDGVAGDSVYTGGNDYAEIATYTAAGALGTGPNVPDTHSVFSFADGDELYGIATTGVSYATTIPGGQPAGTYVLNIVYTLTGL